MCAVVSDVPLSYKSICAAFISRPDKTIYSLSLRRLYKLDSIRVICFYLSAPSATEFFKQIEWISVDWIFSSASFFFRLNLSLSAGFARVYFSFCAL